MIRLNQHFILRRVDRPSHLPHLNTLTAASRHQPLTQPANFRTPGPFWQSLEGISTNNSVELSLGRQILQIQQRVDRSTSRGIGI
ncbi:MAG: hypothetical protein WCD53_15510 [Microcoleus sp.]